jgi:hypothetical protein
VSVRKKKKRKKDARESYVPIASVPHLFFVRFTFGAITGPVRAITRHGTRRPPIARLALLMIASSKFTSRCVLKGSSRKNVFPSKSINFGQ